MDDAAGLVLRHVEEEMSPPQPRCFARKGRPCVRYQVCAPALARASANVSAGNKGSWLGTLSPKTNGDGSRLGRNAELPYCMAIVEAWVILSIKVERISGDRGKLAVINTFPA
jgi:hypothetical protein